MTSMTSRHPLTCFCFLESVEYKTIQQDLPFSTIWVYANIGTQLYFIDYLQVLFRSWLRLQPAGLSYSEATTWRSENKNRFYRNPPQLTKPEYHHADQPTPKTIQSGLVSTFKCRTTSATISVGFFSLVPKTKTRKKGRGNKKSRKSRRVRKYKIEGNAAKNYRS